MPIIQVVLFDLGGTLLHYEQPPELTFERLNASALRAFLGAATAQGASVPDQELAIRAVGRMGAALEAKSKRTFYASTAETVIRDGLEAVNVRLTGPAWEAGIAAYYAVVAGAAKPVAGDAVRVLATLAGRGHGLGLVSNTLWTPALHDADLARFGLLEYLPAAGRFYSSETGFAKPHPNAYRKALDAFNVAPAEAVFVGDRPDVDVAGPQKIGMRAVLVDSPYRSGRGESDPEIVPDAQIATLDELPPVLEEWERALEGPHGQSKG